LNQQNIHTSLGEWVESLLSNGKNAFSLKLAHDAFSELSETAVKRSLDRLSKKRKIISIYRGYYLIIPPQYSANGILPPPLYIDGFMQFLNRPYYVGLLSAAAYHGAAHQQPQEFFVATSLPTLRATQRKGIKVNYISKKSINQKLIESRKAESGYLKISSPALTAVDLVQFEKRIGGLNRAATVLNELCEVLKPEMFSSALLNEVSTYSIQRLGYLLENKLQQQELADALFSESKNIGLSFFRVPLKSGSPTKGFTSDGRWKIIANTELILTSDTASIHNGMVEPGAMAK
jgi:predicted transcriptional regulator of viral defense system